MFATQIFPPKFSPSIWSLNFTAHILHLIAKSQISPIEPVCVLALMLRINIILGMGMEFCSIVRNITSNDIIPGNGKERFMIAIKFRESIVLITT